MKINSLGKQKYMSLKGQLMQDIRISPRCIFFLVFNDSRRNGPIMIWLINSLVKRATLANAVVFDKS